MLDPFLFGSGPQSVRNHQASNDDLITQVDGRPTWQTVRRAPLALRLGRLLIRMGNKLTREGSPGISTHGT